MSESIIKNYKIILDAFFKYLPSRFFVILNSVIIIPFLANILSESEMSSFQICIGVLNLLCTLSTDWVAKTVLRFWQKHKETKTLDSFLSNIILIAILSYLAIIVTYFFAHDLIYSKLQISSNLLILTLFLIIPCGIRQVLYQLLRIYNKPFLYTFSIILYQFLMLSLFLVFSKGTNHTIAILEAMGIAIFCIDIYVIKQIKLKYKIKLSVNKNIVQENLKYSIPLIFTNLSLWSIFHISKFVFQYKQDFLDTAISGLAWFFISGFLSVIYSTFMLSVFPVIIKQFEKGREIKNFVSATLILYFVLFVPIVGIFCFFAKDVTEIFLSHKYLQAHILLPYFAISVFAHELLKIINIKYHLRNKTYLETIITMIVGIVAISLNIALIPLYGLNAVGAITLFSILLLLVLNSAVNFKSVDYIKPKSVIRACVICIICATASYCVINLIFFNKGLPAYYKIVEVIMYLILYYITVWLGRLKILE